MLLKNNTAPVAQLDRASDYEECETALLRGFLLLWRSNKSQFWRFRWNAFLCADFSLVLPAPIDGRGELGGSVGRDRVPLRSLAGAAHSVKPADDQARGGVVRRRFTASWIEGDVGRGSARPAGKTHGGRLEILRPFLRGKFLPDDAVGDGAAGASPAPGAHIVAAIVELLKGDRIAAHGRDVRTLREHQHSKWS